MTNHPNRNRSVNTETYKISYRYVPGSLGNGSSLDNGAVQTIARRTIKSARKAYAAIKADGRIQWVELTDKAGKIEGNQALKRTGPKPFRADA